MVNKFVILGPSSSGKSTVGKILKEKYNLPIFEVDDEVARLNGGIWPENTEVIDKYFDQIHKSLLQKDNIIFITSFLDKHEIQIFKKEGYKFIALFADFEFLLERRMKRESLDKGLKDRFKKRHGMLIAIINSYPNLFEKIINVSKMSTEQIIKEVLGILDFP